MGVQIMISFEHEMNSVTHVQTNRNEYVLSSVAGLLFLFQILVLFFHSNFWTNLIILGIGWLLLIPSFFLIMMSANSLRKYRNLQKGADCPETTSLVRHGTYAVARHPLYLGWMFMSAALAMISQYWLSGILSLIVIPSVLALTRLEDNSNATKFGEEYSRYQKEVPLMNIFVGLWRYRRERVS